MKNYQDLLNVGDNEKNRTDFVFSTISDYKGSNMYATAFDAEEYDRQHNVTILSYQKFLHTVTGQAVVDDYSPNHKIPSNFFHVFVTQENQYLLSNGVQLKPENKKKLGKYFDRKLQELGRCALVGGMAFGYWAYDQLQVFKLTEFVPLFDDKSPRLMAGIRFYQQDSDKPLRATLYEIDGYTEYLQDKDGKREVMQEKRAYKTVTRGDKKDREDGTLLVEGENYPGFPVIPMYGNPHKESELVGIRAEIDAYDLLMSTFTNEIDSERLYWIIKNAGGMEDVDLAQFLERLRTVGAATAEDADDITPHEVSIPFEAVREGLDRLEQNMYRDFQALSVKDISGGNITATQIKSAYQAFDNKVNDYEYCVLQFLDGLFEIVGIDDDPSFVRDKVISSNEDMQTLMLAANYLSDDFITEQACAYLGAPDAVQDILSERAKIDTTRLLNGRTNDSDASGDESGEGEPDDNSGEVNNG